MHASAWIRWTAAAALALCAPEPAAASGGSATEAVEPRPGNHLSGEASPYLQLHATNPVDWYPWGEEALARARAEDKPIFLSIGYSTCYWCHVMERESFSDPEIAALMNRSVVSVKVDREERPDLDEIYMTATQVLSGSGGWPNSLFLTPAGEPFFAGTYFPPRDARGRPGFARVVEEMARLWKEDRARLESIAQRVSRTIAGSQSSLEPLSIPLDAPRALLASAAVRLLDGFDAEYGGFGQRTKFPRPPRLELLLAAQQTRPDPRVLDALTATLDAMALGGIHDALAGGFHRYSTERTWSVPHFEKMLYDNGQLLGLYARAFAVTRRPLYRQVALDVAGWLEREMRLPEGGFASAQDAEVDEEEGASYVWTREQIVQTLGEEDAEALLSFYTLRPLHAGGPGVLRVALPLEPALARRGAKDVAELVASLSAQRARLLAARNLRRQPARDDKVLAAWNGLAIRGLVDAAEALGEPRLLRLAEDAAAFVLARLADDAGGLRRSYIAGQAREEGVLDDYAFLGDALLGLYRATGETRWLGAARSLADGMLERFEDPVAGGFYLTPPDVELIVRPRTLEDGVLPSGNGVALRLLAQLAEETRDARYQAAALRTAGTLGSRIAEAPSALGSALVALARGAEPRRPAAPGGVVSVAAAGVASDAGPRLPRSSDHVRARIAPGGGGAAFVVQLEIDPGWHVNANPASLAFLIATTLELEGDGDLASVTYPPGVPFAPSFSETPLSVYAGRIEIAATLPPERPRPVALQVRYQACDLTRCLPPATSPLELD